ncbi:hypothetical protein CALCODRAFT_546638, partial [Calocera cornea HHB12733]
PFRSQIPIYQPRRIAHRQASDPHPPPLVSENSPNPSTSTLTSPPSSTTSDRLLDQPVPSDVDASFRPISPNMLESMMPLRSSRNAPVLESARPEHIVRFLEDVQQLCEGHEVSPEKWVNYSLKYVDIDVAQVWESLPESKAVPTDFAAFRKAVLRLYPGSTNDTRRYTKTDLERIVSKSAAIPMESRAQFGEYY